MEPGPDLQSFFKPAPAPAQAKMARLRLAPAPQHLYQVPTSFIGGSHIAVNGIQYTVTTELKIERKGNYYSNGKYLNLKMPFDW